MSVFSLSRRVLIASLIATPAYARPRHQGRPPAKRISVTVAVDRRGHVTPLWLDLIRDRIDANELAGVRMNARALSNDEAQWIKLIRQVAPDWVKDAGRLDLPFRQVRPPATVQVVVANQGGDDAFSGPPDFIAFDLSALVNAYGALDAPGRAALMHRLLSHEYTHLLINPYLAGLGWTPDWAARDPFLAAVRVLYNEGIANMRSVEGDRRWTNEDGSLTDLARDTLAQLQPVMIERLKGLSAHPSPAQARDLMRNISQGPFARKWGAIPIALWLAADTVFDPERIAAWVEARPDGILDLAAGLADRKYQRAFADLRAKVAERVAAQRA